MAKGDDLRTLFVPPASVGTAVSMVPDGEAIQDTGVIASPTYLNRSWLAVLALGVTALTGCSRAETPPVRDASFTVDRREVTAAQPEVATEPPVTGRHRLSQTITLGQEDPTGYGPRPVAAPAPGANVTVQNNVTIVNTPPVYYGGYGGYGYGYGSYGAGRSDASRGAHGRGGASWGTSGWEGPSRTAAPGRTPGVGGNWAPPPSHGPAPMR